MAETTSGHGSPDPAGRAVVPRRTSDGRGGGWGRWLRPGPPRVVAAVLMLLLQLATTAGGALAALLSGAFRDGPTLALVVLLPVVAGLAVAFALAGFVLTGSAAARLLGALVVAGSWVQLVVPVVLQPGDVDLGSPSGAFVGLLWAAVWLLHAATAIALALPGRAAQR